MEQELSDKEAFNYIFFKDRSTNKAISANKPRLVGLTQSQETLVLFVFLFVLLLLLMSTESLSLYLNTECFYCLKVKFIVIISM